jgi:hypothetical protein
MFSVAWKDKDSWKPIRPSSAFRNLRPEIQAVLFVQQVCIKSRDCLMYMRMIVNCKLSQKKGKERSKQIKMNGRKKNETMIETKRDGRLN